MGDICEENVAGALEALKIDDPISDGEVLGETQIQRTKKDPRKIARGYQIELCQKALEENIIVYLETGCGKTHIAVLLIYEMSFQIKKPQKDVCVFLAPTVALVEQQAKVIQEALDLKVGTYCGSSNRLKGHRDWEKELESLEVLVMTPQILLHNLSHCFIKIERIALLIFDECHYAQAESNHPYAEIMKVFYKQDVAKLPRIFGMTASPKFGKGTSISSLETLLHAKVYSVEDREELDQFVSSPKVNVYHYGTTSTSIPSPHTIYSRKLEVIKHQCLLNLSAKIDDHSALKNAKKVLQRVHGNLLFCLENLGLWGALQACLILLKGDVFERNEVLEANGRCSDDALCGSYLSQVASDFAADCRKDNAVEVNGGEADLSVVEALRVPFFSWKLLKLIGILSNFRPQPEMKCIVFVNRIITARSLAYVLRQIKFLSVWRCGYLVGVHSGLKNISRKTTNAILGKFRSGELNLLVATKVGEEGLDIQTCCLVIRFDLPETVASFIQSRGRARMPQSEYAFLVNRENPRELELIQSFRKDETQMNGEILSRASNSAMLNFEEKTYKVDSTGAIISAGSSISLLHRYCSKLPHDEYFNPRPHFYYYDDAEGTICKIVLPANAPIHHVVSSPQSSMESAKKDSCLKACKELHEVGALTHYLLPDNEIDEEVENFSDSDDDDEGDTRRELHEMLIPATLREPWSKESTRFCLNSYYIKFTPLPADRLYKEFGLFVKAPIPGDGERMTLDLFLARGRSVLTEIVPYGATEFVDDEILLAERFQEMWLKVIIDRSQFTSDFVSLGKDNVSSSMSCYLLLPVTVNEDYGSMTIDWKLVRKCLSSPIFRNPEDSGDGLRSDMNDCLHIASGPIAVEDVLNSLVYVPCKDNFFFISDLLPEKNSFSVCKETKNYVEWYAEVFSIQLLHPNQPLLKAKQLFRLDNMLRKRGNAESREKEEHFVELPAEICQLKILGFSRDIGSSLSVLPSIMHRLESFLVAIELKQRLSASFPEGAEVSAWRVLEALTTERCNERFSLERLEVLGDAFLKFAVGRHLFLSNEALDEGQLTRKRSNMVNNSNLFKLAVSKNLQVYIRDQSFEPSQFFPFGRRCLVICNDNTKASIHSSQRSSTMTGANIEIRCSKCHHWLQKKTVADVVEALVGAFIVDSGFKAAAAFLSWFGIQVDFKESQVAKMCYASVMFTPLSSQIDINALQDLLGYRFQHKGLLLQAFLHPSYNNNSGGCYQRLEFLGDAVLDYLITSYLFSVYPNLKPGQLTDLRSMSVNNNSFAGIAVDRSFHKFILCDSTSLTRSMNKFANFIKNYAPEDDNMLFETVSCPKVLGDLVESCVGAILLDSGFNLDLVWKIMLSFLDPVMKFSALQLNPVRELQELCQFYDWELNFPSIKKDGVFSVEAKVDGKGISETAWATNSSKKSAKRIAAKNLYRSLKDKGYKTKMKSLEDILKLSQKMEAKLIGFDETPADVNATDTNQLEHLNSKEPTLSSLSREIHPTAVNSVKSSSSCIRRLVQPASQCNSSPRVDTAGPSTNLSCNGDSQTNAGGLSKSSAKSHLYEICAANYWKPPLFECCQESGPAHLKEFVFKVTVEIEESECREIECIGKPRSKKKDAAESAAIGLIWYLKKSGYLKV